MPEQRTNYYEIFPEISPEMRAGDIRQALEKKAAVLAARFDEKSLKLQDQIEAALGIFRDEAGKQAYDRALAQRVQMQQQEDPLQKQREELENLKQRAESYLSGGEYDLAKMATEKMLQLGAARDDSGAHWLAARVFRANKAYDPALEHINRVIFEEPENIDPLLFKAALFAEKAGQLKDGPDFSASPQLQQEAQKCRSERRRQLKKAVELAKDSGGEPEAHARGLLAHALYFDPDPDARADDRAAGVAEAQEAQRCGTSEEARAVLQDHAEMQQTNEWYRLAEKNYDKGESHQAKTLIEKALAAAGTPAALEAGRTPSAKAYRLASSIYNSLGEYGAALQHIERAIQLEPQHCGLIIDKGLILAGKVEKLHRSSGFRSSAQQQEAYRKFRAMELETLREAYRKAAGAGNLQRREIAAQILAHALYFGCDALDESKARQERSEGVKLAREALSYNISSCEFAREVLNDHTAKQKAQQERQLAEQKAQRERQLAQQKAQREKQLAQQKAQQEKQLAEQRAQREKQLAQQKAQQEKQKAEWEAQLKRVQSFCDDGQFDVARAAVEKILRENANRCDSRLYALAANIYHKNQEYDAALQYINEALAREPDNVYDNVLKGQIYGGKTLRITENSQFRSSAELQKEYARLRELELKSFRKACDLANEQFRPNVDLEKDQYTEELGYAYADAAGHLADALYFRSDQLNASKARTEKKEAQEYARSSRGIAPNWNTEAKTVLEKENDKKAERDQWTKRARKYHDNKEWTQAKSAVSRALEMDVAEHSDKEDAHLYWLAASVYYNGKINYDIALAYINDALALSPDDLYDTVLKGLICGSKALQITENSRFRSSPELQKEYAKFRALELDTLDKACDFADEEFKKDPGSRLYKGRYAYALGHLAFALYFRPDQLDASKARAEKNEAPIYARMAQKAAPDYGGEALKVLQAAGKR